MSSWPPVSRDDLKAAAASAGFDTVFPLLMRRLIAETADGLISLDMPGGSGTAGGGFDGVVTATGQSTFVPSGTSVWELSVGGGQAKADEDYDKRTTGPDNLPTQTVAYVEALLVPWTKARAWAAARTKEGRWWEVRGYNLDRIHAWLDVAPATTAWLAGQLGKALPGVRCLGTWWSDSWLPSTRVPLDHTIVLAGREKAAADFVAQLAIGRSLITLGGDLRQDDACAFVAAALQQSGALDATSVGVRTLFVSDTTSLAQLIAQPQPLILVLADPVLARDLPAQHRHQLIVSAPMGGQGDVEVPRLHGQAVETQFQSAGLPHDEAARLGTLGRRSLLALRRTLAHHPGLLTPSWATAPDVIRRRLLLLGSWNGENQEDRRIVTECLGLPYEQVQEQALQLAAGTDIPFIGHTDEIWHLLAVEDAWTLLGASLTNDDLDALHKAVVEVLSELDPVLDLDPDKRWMAGITGVRRRFSHTLRSGLAQSLALLGAGGPGLRGRGGLTAAQWARQPVRDLLARANADNSYRLWSSLSEVLCLLAEAAPDAFLQAMHEGLRGTPPLHAAMFTDNASEKLGMGGNSPHTHFLWALETLAWSPEYIDDAVDVLAALTAVDPGGKLSNRPMASLVGIISAWSPNTSADTDSRIRAIERLMRQHPAVGRKLLRKLIPDGHGFQTVHPGPRFRDWKTKTPVTRSDLVRVVNTVVELLLKDLDTSPERYLGMIGKIDILSQGHRREIAERLTTLGGTLDDEEQRAQIFDALRNKIAKHREHADAKWALPEKELRHLQAACDAFEPRRPDLRHAWLFSSHWVTLGDKSRREDYASYETEVLRRRAHALGEIIAEGGLDALIAFTSTTKYPALVGIALAERSDSYDIDMLSWLESDIAPQRDVAAAYLGHRLRSGGEELRDGLLARTEDALTKARILRFTGDPAMAWPKLAELGQKVTEHYWREFIYFGLGPEFPRALEAAWCLLDAGRPSAALDLIMLYGLKQDGVEGAEVVAAGLERLLETGLDDP